MAALWSWGFYRKQLPSPETAELLWSLTGGALNVLASVLGWWRCFANNYLPWAAIGTWLLCNAQGE